MSTTAELESKRDELVELLELRDRLNDPDTVRQLHDVTNQLLVEERRLTTERQVAGREFETTAAAYESARGETFQAIRAYVAAVERARRLRETVDAERKRCVKLGVSERELDVPELTQVLAPRNREWHELLVALRVANNQLF